MSQVLSSVQHICSQEAQPCFFPWAPSNLSRTLLTLMAC